MSRQRSGLTQGLYIHPAFFDRQACRRVRAAMDDGVIEPAEVLDRGVNTEVRRVASIDVDELTLRFVESALDGQRDPIAAALAMDLRAREGAGFLRYGPGGFFRPHRDRGNAASWPGAAQRRVALVVFLNGSSDMPAAGEFSGGALRLLPEQGDPLEIAPRPGWLVAFPASTLHEVEPVRDGTRDAIVDWFY